MGTCGGSTDVLREPSANSCGRDPVLPMGRQWSPAVAVPGPSISAQRAIPSSHSRSSRGEGRRPNKCPNMTVNLPGGDGETEADTGWGGDLGRVSWEKQAKISRPSARPASRNRKNKPRVKLDTSFYGQTVSGTSAVTSIDTCSKSPKKCE